MGMMEEMARRASEGQTVNFRPRGNSMRPIVSSGDLVTVAPLADPSLLEVGDVVLVRVAGTTYLHLVSAVDPQRARVQIRNNRGRVNGWAPFRQVHGICTEVEGIERPKSAAKARSQPEDEIAPP